MRDRRIPSGVAQVDSHKERASMAVFYNVPSKAIITSVGSASNGGTSGEAFPVIMGTADAGTAVTVYDGVRWLGTTIVTSDGLWSLTPPAALKAGLHKFTAISMNSEDQWGASSTQLSVTIDTSTPVAPVITEVMDNVGPVQGPVAQDGTTDDVRPVISGTGKPGYMINLYDNGMLMATTQVDAHGMWSIRPANPLPSSMHDLIAIQTDMAGKGGMISEHFAFLIELSLSVVSSGHAWASQDGGHNIDSAHESNGVPHATGHHPAIDFIPVVGKTATAESRGVEIIDVNEQHNALKLSLDDVLNRAESDLFLNGDKHSTRMDGKTSDAIASPDAHVTGLVEAEWRLNDALIAGGDVNPLAGHSSALAEQLAQQGLEQGVELAMH
jgi:Bacterial Ig-like domain